MDYNQWCRLCATTNGAEIDVFSTSLDLKELILKHFGIMITVEDKICKNCYGFIEKIAQFIETVTKVNQMFLDLRRREDSFRNYDAIRQQYEVYEPIKFELIDSMECSEKSDQILSNIDPCISIKAENVDVEEQNHLEQSEKLPQVNTIEMQSNKNIRNKSENNNLGSKIIENSTIEEADDLIEKDYKVKTKKGKRIKKEKTNLKKFDNIRNKSEENYLNSYTIENMTIQKTIESNKEDDIIKTKKGKRVRIETPSECSICNRKFSFRHVLREHIKTIHSEPQFQCKICFKKFGSERSLKFHGDVHLPYEQRYACPYCDKKFTKSVNLKPHIRAVHLGEKSFVCEECGKAFGTNGNLKDHMYTHKLQSSYKCLQCGKEFKNKKRLHVHKDTHSDTVYYCSKCGIQLKTKRTLNTHMLVHSDEKKHKCEHCEMAFKRPGHLKRHLISHLGLKLYSCQFCDKTFTNTQNCRLHMSKIHSNEIAKHESTGTELVKITCDAPSMNQLKAITGQVSSSECV